MIQFDSFDYYFSDGLKPTASYVLYTWEDSDLLLATRWRRSLHSPMDSDAKIQVPERSK